jgi:uncharacterized membrane protein YhfC
MDINYAFLATNIITLLVVLGVPIALAVVLIRRFKGTWWAILLTGFLSFEVAQGLFYFSIRYLSGVLQNSKLFQGNSIWALVLYALLIGTLSALFVELMRLAGFLLLRKKARSFSSALGFGVGSGLFSGVTQSFFNGGIGLSVLVYFFIALTFNPGALLAKGMDSASVTSMMQQVQQIWAAPWHYGLILGVESLIMLSMGIVLSTFVWKSVAYRQWVWLLAAFLYHILNIGAMYFMNMIGWNVWLMEAVLTAFLLVNVYLIYTFWKEESAIEEDEEFTDDEEGEESNEDEINLEADDIDEISVDEDDTDEIAEVIDHVDDDESGNK